MLPRATYSIPMPPTRCSSVPCFWLHLDTRRAYTSGATRYYRRSDTGQILTLDEAPVGAMWDGYDKPVWWGVGLDRLRVLLRTPAGDVSLDDSRAAYLRTGIPPCITLKAKDPGEAVVRVGDYCAALTDGVLTSL